MIAAGLHRDSECLTAVFPPPSCVANCSDAKNRLMIVRGHCPKKISRYKGADSFYSTRTHDNSHIKKTRKPSCRRGYAPITGNGAIRSADHENSSLEPNMCWIGCTVCEIFAFKLYCDLETGVRGHSRSSKVALFDRAHTTLYSSSIVTMPLSITVCEI